VLIRLCHVAELPPPAELVRRLTEAGGPAPPGGGGAGGGVGGGSRAVANGAPLASAPPLAAAFAPGAPRLASLRDVAAVLAEQREATLHAHLLQSVHLVRMSPGVIELRPQPQAPRDLAARLGAALLQATGTRWTIALSTAEGEPTLAEQDRLAENARQVAAMGHPLVRAILAAFPGASVGAVQDRPAGPASAAAEPDLPPDVPPWSPLDAGPEDDEFSATDIPEEFD